MSDNIGREIIKNTFIGPRYLLRRWPPHTKTKKSVNKRKLKDK